MAEIGLAEAARLTGKNRSTLHRAMRAGRLSYSVNDAGERRIDVAELQRVFALRPGAVEHINGATLEATPGSLQRHSAQPGEVATLRETITRQDATITELHATIRFLQQRCETTDAERRHLSERLTALLTHRQTGSVPAVTLLSARRPWWRRWFR